MKNPKTPTIMIAPMLDWTDRHARYFLRLFSKHIIVFTEMVTTGAIIHGDVERHLAFNVKEQPIILQLGGSNPKELAQCAKIAEEWGYQGINLNVGCPSDRVQSGMFGACLMKHPELVRDCMLAMSEACDLPLSVKTRIGVDDFDAYPFLQSFVEIVSESGVTDFILHARKAWLSGLSPKENREIPPLLYDRVYQIKKDFPHLTITINGGIKTLSEMDNHLKEVDGVMIGREAYHHPYLLANIDQRYFGESYPVKTRAEIMREYLSYIEECCGKGEKLTHMTRHIMGLYHQKPRAREWRRTLSEDARDPIQGLMAVKRIAKSMENQAV